MQGFLEQWFLEVNVVCQSSGRLQSTQKAHHREDEEGVYFYGNAKNASESINHWIEPRPGERLSLCTGCRFFHSAREKENIQASHSQPRSTASLPTRAKQNDQFPYKSCNEKLRAIFKIKVAFHKTSHLSARRMERSWKQKLIDKVHP